MKLTASLDEERGLNTKVLNAAVKSVSQFVATRKVKNEFMSQWDGLKSRENERVIVLGATNRPFDLDDAVLRRFPRRMLVDLPDANNREKILRVILRDENLEEDFAFDNLSQMTDGYSGSDLKNLCIAAAYIPIREYLEAEKQQDNQQSQPATPASDSKVQLRLEVNKKEVEEVQLRPLTLQDFENAKKEVSVSVNEDTVSISELRKWNDLYGEGGSRRTTALSYFM